MTKRYWRVYPVFIRQGLVWETAELHALRRFLRAAKLPGIQPLTILEFPAGDLYGKHWSTTGKRVPGAKTRDEAVYLPGRNLMLLSKAAVFCALHNIPVIAVGSLGHNPFADATPKFFRDFARVSGVRVIAPFRKLEKTTIVRLYRAWPLHLSFSCLSPQRGRHCQHCNKCAERQQAFDEAATSTAKSGRGAVILPPRGARHVRVRH